MVFGVFGAIVKKYRVLSQACKFAGAILAGDRCCHQHGFFIKDRMPEKSKEKTGLKEAIPVVKKSISLKASYMCSLDYPC